MSHRTSTLRLYSKIIPCKFQQVLFFFFYNRGHFKCTIFDTFQNKKTEGFSLEERRWLATEKTNTQISIRRKQSAAAAAKSRQSCPTLCDPHRRQPTRLPRSWDSPGKNTGVGCYFLLQCMKVKSESEVAQSCPTQRPHGLQPTRFLCPWDFPGKSAGVGKIEYT